MKKIENKHWDNLSEEQKKKLKEILEENSKDINYSYSGCIRSRKERIIDALRNIFR